MDRFYRPPIALLAVSDDSVRALLEAHLGARNFTVEVAHRDDYAVAVLAHCDAVLCDARLWRELSQEPARPAEVVVVSAEPSAEEETAMRACGARDYFAIPFTAPGRLTSVLDAVTARIAEARHRALEEQAEQLALR